MIRTFKSRIRFASQISRWYVLRWGNQLRVACITPEGAYKLHERGWQLGERVCDSRQEAEEHRAQLEDRARRFRERQRMLVLELARQPKMEPGSGVSNAEAAPGASVSQRFDVSISNSVFNGFNLN